MSYIDTTISKNGKLVLVWERDKNDKIQLVKHIAPYNCYIEAPEGEHKSIFPDRKPLKQLLFKDRWELEAFVKGTKDNNFEDAYPDIVYESDISPDLKILAGSYYRKSPPNLHVTFLDIEADADLKNIGWPTVNNPYGEITAISLYHQWLDKTIVLANVPNDFSKEYPTKEELGCDEIHFFPTEAYLLGKFVELIDDSDVLSGWNSDKFDIPYIIERLKIYLKEDGALKALCRDEFKAKAKKVKMRFSKEEETVYKLVGRVSLDYMQVYKKFTFQEQPSYSLENISQFELGYGKLTYEGSLPNLYREDFTKFLKYNIHDTILLRDLDRKLQFFALVNEMAHDCSARLYDVLGTVVLTDQAFMSYAWHERDQRIPDRDSNYGVPEYKSWINSIEGMKERNTDASNPHKESSNARFVGAYVHDLGDKKGLHEYTASIDLASLYPNTIIALNISPETMTAYAKTDDYDHQKYGMDILWDKKMNWTNEEKGTKHCWGARKDIIGLVPEVLSYWIDQRLELQAKMKSVGDEERAYYKRLQHVKKIQLNSAYGALGNKYSHFFNLALAEACTFGSRGIMKHMFKTIGYLVDDHEQTGDEIHELNAPSIIYGDTDSCYFKLSDVKNDKEAIIYSDYIATEVNRTFQNFMIVNHSCDEARASKIKAEREIVADRSLFVDKKRYAMHVINDRGDKVDKMKVMGLEVVQSSTPKIIQTFLSDILNGVLKDKKDEKETAKTVHAFRRKFYNDLELEDFGMPIGVKKIEDYANRILVRKLLARQEECINESFVSGKRLTREEEEIIMEAQRDRSIDPNNGKTRWQLITDSRTVPGHVQASLNWNSVLREREDKIRTKVSSGMKIRVYYLKQNRWEFKSIAIPTDEPEIPDWFRELPFDMKKMGEVLIDQKLKSIYSALKWDMPKEATDDVQFEGFMQF